MFLSLLDLYNGVINYRKIQINVCLKHFGDEGHVRWPLKQKKKTTCIKTGCFLL